MNGSASFMKGLNHHFLTVLKRTLNFNGFLLEHFKVIPEIKRQCQKLPPLNIGGLRLCPFIYFHNDLVLISLTSRVLWAHFKFRKLLLIPSRC